jgi:putative flippase GtrA
MRYNLATGILAVIVNVGVVRLLVTALRMNYLVAGALATPCAGLLCFVISDALIFVRPKTREATT